LDFDGAKHKKVWQDDPVWQGVRRNVEELTAIGDWAQSLFAANIVFESLVGVLFRSHLVMQISARNNDYVTPTLIGAGEHDYGRDLGYTRALFKMLTSDETHGDKNKATLQGWLDRWVPVSVKAAHDLQPIWSQPAEKVVTFADSWTAARTDFATVLGELGLSEPKELLK